MVNSQQVDAKHPAYNKFINEWQMIDDCVAGKRAIKDRKERYLPRPNENDDGDNERYAKYLSRASFINATGRTLSGLIGIAFNKQPKIELKGALKALENDADGEEQPLFQFIRDSLTQTLKRGRAGVFVDFTSSGEQTELTKGRAILRLFNAKQIINWRVTQGKTSLVVLKYEEPTNTDDFNITMITKFIELRLIEDKALVRHWTKDGEKGWYITLPEDANGNKKLFAKYSTDENNIVTIKTYTKKFDFEKCEIVAGEPQNITEGRWIDLRLEMPVVEIDEPILPIASTLNPVTTD